jgi:multidrug efflux pump subunit AcrB
VIKFLIHRPIAVSMTFLAILVLGVVASTLIPVSLMPDIDIPVVTVQVNSKNASARQLENTVIKPFSQQLTQVAHLTDIHSETRDEKSIITLSFEYGTDIDFAFIEVNEKIDRAMNSFPREISRPRVIKASVTDLPVYYLNLTLKNQNTQHQLTENQASETLSPASQRFVELSSFTNQVIRKRLEQLPEIAIADISGLVYPEILVVPNMHKLEALQISLSQLEAIIRSGNVTLGNLLIRDGQYQYSVRFNATLSTKRDIENVYFKSMGRLLQLKDIATVTEHSQKRQGMVTFNGKNAITMAIIKQSDARMGDLEESLDKLMEQFTKNYPDIDFSITRDQTQLLNYSISNLSQNLISGALLAFIVMFLFLKDFKSPLLIGLSMPASLVISLIFFHIMGISINIISLSGLVLGLGMMIDNSIIVIDNITQYIERGSSLLEACIHATNEVTRPMISSMLTGCAVFLPLIFLSGISGALFYDQALAVAIGHFASLLVSITIIPVYYKIIYSKGNTSGHNKWLSKINSLNYEALYEKTFRLVMRHQLMVWGIIASFLLGAVLLFVDLPKSKLPPLTKDEILLSIDWNERINIEENNLRIQKLMMVIDTYITQHSCLVGEQQFLLDRKANADASEAVIYIKAKTPDDLAALQKTIPTYISKAYSHAVFSFKEADNLFNLIFPEGEPPLIARLRSTEEVGPEQNSILKKALSDIQKILPDKPVGKISWQEHLVLKADVVKMMAYDIPVDAVYGKLKTAFGENEVFVIKDNQDFVPVIVGGKATNISEVLAQTYVSNKKGDLYPVRELVTEACDYDLKTIVAGQEGEYFPIDLNVDEKEVGSVMEKLKAAFTENAFYEIDFGGSIFASQVLIQQLSIILLISLLLLYFILASQFESLLLPLIVLIEIPIDLFGSFLFLKIFGSGINLMSMIGLVVMSGIIINDSILKVDTANQLVKEGYSLLRALLVTGQRRLKPILMTSLVTVLAMVPLLFTGGIGAELQKPLALALTGGMLLGTLVSLYFIPLCYYYIMKNKPRTLNRITVSK